MDRAVRLRISGVVQGVFFRASTRDEAVGLGLNGWVRNCLDGSVEAWVQGERDCVDRLIQWCHSGPPSAHVDRIECDEVEVDPSLESFEVRYGD